VSISIVGSIRRVRQEVLIAAFLFVAVIFTNLGPVLTRSHFTPHFEMLAVFWCGIIYHQWTQAPTRVIRDNKIVLALVAISLLIFFLIGERSFERTALTLCVACLVHIARNVSFGARITDYSGDMSYGIYIFAFPVQQMVVHMGSGRSWSWNLHFGFSLLITFLLAYASWHLVESRALRYKPGAAKLLKASEP
jgi:peptidoglycan/LPS O-acetylase OafA/YrhL